MRRRLSHVLLLVFVLYLSFFARGEKTPLHENYLRIFDKDQSSDIFWIKSYGGSSSEIPYSMQPTLDGGYIFAGYSYSFGNGSKDVWIVKLSSEGEIEWQKAYGGDLNDGAFSIFQTSDEDFIVAGFTCSSNEGNCDIWILKLSWSGDVEWQRTYGGNQEESSTNCIIRETNDGGLIVATNTRSFNSNAPQMNSDILLLKLTSKGRIEWQKTYGCSGSDDEDAWDVYPDGDGGYILLGYNHGSKLGDYWLLKLSSEGSVEWQRVYGGPEDDRPYFLLPLKNEGYIIGGYTQSFLTTEELFQWEGWILKLGTTGDIEWQKVYRGNDAVSIHAVKKTADGGFIAVGQFGKDNLPGQQDSYVLIIKLSVDGNIEWQRSYGVNGPDAAYSVHQAEKGDFYVCGFTGGVNSDIFVMKLSIDGEIGPGCIMKDFTDITCEETFIAPIDTACEQSNVKVIKTTTDVFPEETHIFPELLCWNLHQPPENITVKQVLNRSLFRKEYYNTLTWNPNSYNSSFSISEYRIYKRSSGDYQLIGTVPANTYVFQEGPVDSGETFSYAITSVDLEGRESPKAFSNVY